MCKIAEAHRQLSSLISLFREQKVNPSLALAAAEAMNGLLLEALAENRPKTMGLTHERLLEVLRYDPETGHFYWRIDVSSSAPRASRAGSLCNGYRLIQIDGVTYKASRLAWFYVYGCWPEFYVDHINKVRDDDRIKNLRDVTRYVNGRNVDFKNPWGCPGVRKSKTPGRFEVSFRVNGKATYFGTYDDPYDAVKACNAARKAHGVELG